MYTNSDLNPQDRQSYLDKLSDGAYSIQSLDGVPILPSAWRTIVKPNLRIKIAFDNPSRSYSRSQSRFQLQDARQSGPGANTARENLAVSIEVLDSVRHSLESEDSINTEDYHGEDTSTSSEEDTPLKPPQVTAIESVYSTSKRSRGQQTIIPGDNQKLKQYHDSQWNINKRGEQERFESEEAGSGWQ